MYKRKTVLAGLLIVSAMFSAVQAQVEKMPRKVSDVVLSDGGVIVRRDTIIEYDVPPVPQDRTEEILYNRRWFVTTNKNFAEYRREAFYPANEEMPNEYKTYYLKSGKLQGQGYFETLDKTNDEQSRFKGECITYYENGNIDEHKYFTEGLPDGLCAKFTEDGKQCLITPYNEGATKGFSVKYGIEGSVCKCDLEGKNPILETPDPNDPKQRKKEYQKGVEWQYYNTNGLIIGMSNDVNKAIGYRELGIYLLNKGMVDVSLFPKDFRVYNVKKGKQQPFKIVSVEEYEKKLHKGKAGYNLSTSTKIGSANGGKTEDVKAFQKKMVEMKEIASFESKGYADKLPESLGYLQNTTVHPDEVVSGFLYTDDKTAEDLFVELTVNGIKYVFEWK